MRENLKKIESFEVLLQIISFCMTQWRTRVEVTEFMQLRPRTAQRHIKQLIESGFMEERGRMIGATSKSYKMLINGVKTSDKS